MSEIVRVGMADLNVCKAPDIITTLGLGSCIGLTLYDPSTKIGVFRCRGCGVLGGGWLREYVYR